MRKNSWQAAYERCSEQTRADIDSLLARLREKGTQAASDLFKELDKARKWKMWEALAVKDIVLGLNDATHSPEA